MSDIKNWLKEIFFVPHIAERILDELMKVDDDDDWVDLEEWRDEGDCSEDEESSGGENRDFTFGRVRVQRARDQSEIKYELHIKTHQHDSDLVEEEGKRSLVNVLPLRLVCRDMKNIVDNCEKVWSGFDEDQPLLYPTVLGHVDNIRKLLRKRVNVNERGAEDRWESDRYWDELPPSPLDLAARYGVLDSVKVRLKKRACMSPEDAEGWDFPIHHAAKHGHISVVELLLSKGMDINAEGGTGLTALHYAAEKGHKDVVELLITKGADVNHWECDGMSPLDWALYHGQEEIAKLIETHGGERNDPHGYVETRTCEECKIDPKNPVVWLFHPVWLFHQRSHAKIHGEESFEDVEEICREIKEALMEDLGITK